MILFINICHQSILLIRSSSLLVVELPVRYEFQRKCEFVIVLVQFIVY